MCQYQKYILGFLRLEGNLREPVDILKAQSVCAHDLYVLVCWPMDGSSQDSGWRPDVVRLVRVPHRCAHPSIYLSTIHSDSQPGGVCRVLQFATAALRSQ